MTKPKMSWDGRTLTVHVPLAFRKRGGRKIIIAPQGAEAWAPPRPGVDNTLVKALARAFRWRKLLETGMHTTVGEIAAAEKINPSYLTRVLRLTLLAPDIVEAILDVWQPAGLQLDGLLEPFPVEGAAEAGRRYARCHRRQHTATIVTSQAPVEQRY
jgi:hypothetical protein